MKRIKQILICGMTLCILFAAAVPVLAAETQPDWIISATFDGALHLSPKDVTFSSENDIGPGDAYTSNILFRNSTKQTVQFSLGNILNALTDNPKSLEMLGGLDVSITIDGKEVYSGTYDKALGLSSDWFTVGAGGQIPVQVSYAMPAGNDNRYQSLTYKVSYMFNARTIDTQAPIIPKGPKTGAPAIIGNTIDALIYANIAMAVAAALIVILYLKRKKQRETREDG